MTRHSVQRCLVGLLVILPLLAAPARGAGFSDNRAVRWDGDQVTELGTLGGAHSRALAINNAGQVVGYAETASGAQHAVLWEGGRMTDLGTLGGYSAAHDINEAGQVVGESDTDTSSARHAVLWEGGAITDLGTLGGTSSRANAINNAGQVVGGSSTDANEEYHAVQWDEDQATDLGTQAGTYSEAMDINDSGQVVGMANTDEDEFPWRAVLWADGTMTDLATLGGDGGSAFGINNVGQVAGYATTAKGEGHAARWDGEQVDDLGESEAFGINDAGQVVGWRYAAVRPSSVATPLATPGAAACTVEPRTAEAQIALWFEDRAGTPTVRTAQTPVPAAGEAALPPGEPADAATVAAVTATVREMEACSNAGEYFRGLALFSDELIRQTLPPPGTTLEDVRAALAAPAISLPAEQRVPPTTIRDVRVLADGRVGLVVSGSPPGVEAFFVFARVGERWLVDEFIIITGAETPPATTPAP